MWRTPCLPTMDKLVKGRVYYTRCRNLSYAVWNGSSGFIGIRTKFGDRYLFTEYHYDYCEHYGTVNYAKDLGIDVPDDILTQERLGLWDKLTDRFVEDVNDKDGNHLHGDPPDSWLYQYVDTKEQICVPYSESRIFWKGNKPLQDFLNEIAKSRNDDDDYEASTQEIREAIKKRDSELEDEVENHPNIIIGED